MPLVLRRLLDYFFNTSLLSHAPTSGTIHEDQLDCLVAEGQTHSDDGRKWPNQLQNRPGVLVELRVRIPFVQLCTHREDTLRLYINEIVWKNGLEFAKRWVMCVYITLQGKLTCGNCIFQVLERLLGLLVDCLHSDLLQANTTPQHAAIATSHGRLGRSRFLVVSQSCCILWSVPERQNVCAHAHK